jgi:hypothetical protein
MADIDLDRLDEPVGRLAPEEQRAVDEELEIVLGLQCAPSPSCQRSSMALRKSVTAQAR